MPQTASVAPDTVSSWLDAGATLEEIEVGLLDAAPLNDERRAMLWLYAWSRVRHPGRPRRTLHGDLSLVATERTVSGVQGDPVLFLDAVDRRPAPLDGDRGLRCPRVRSSHGEPERCPC